jgi:hypothetical protein
MSKRKAPTKRPELLTTRSIASQLDGKRRKRNQSQKRPLKKKKQVAATNSRAKSKSYSTVQPIGRWRTKYRLTSLPMADPDYRVGKRCGRNDGIYSGQRRSVFDPHHRGRPGGRSPMHRRFWRRARTIPWRAWPIALAPGSRNYQNSSRASGNRRSRKPSFPRCERALSCCYERFAAFTWASDGSPVPL